jgi:hypothetical protein
LKSEELQNTQNEVRNEEKTELVENTISSDNPQPTTHNSQQITETLQTTPQVSELKPQVPTYNQPKVSALSLSSIRAKKEMMEAQKGVVKEQVYLPSQAFTEIEMLDFWFKYAQRLTDKGLMIMSSLLRISDPKLDGFKIIYELPNEGSKIDFEKEKGELLGYLRGHLHNHDITIEVVVNESVKSKVAFTAQDKFNRLNEINPNLEELRRMFDLDI